MTLMLAAESLGYASGPMSGFDPAQLQRAFDLNSEEWPVMLLAVGRPATPPPPAKIRLPIERVLQWA